MLKLAIEEHFESDKPSITGKCTLQAQPKPVYHFLGHPGPPGAFQGPWAKLRSEASCERSEDSCERSEERIFRSPLSDSFKMHFSAFPEVKMLKFFNHEAP